MDINNIPKDLQNFLSIALLLPFWYVGVKLFNPELYDSNDMILIVCVCYCLSLTSTFFMLLIMQVDDDSDGLHLFHQDMIFPALGVQIAILSLIIFIGYLFKVLSGSFLTFYGFVSIHFGLILFILLITILFPSKKGKT